MLLIHQRKQINDLQFLREQKCFINHKAIVLLVTNVHTLPSSFNKIVQLNGKQCLFSILVRIVFNSFRIILNFGITNGKNKKKNLIAWIVHFQWELILIHVNFKCNKNEQHTFKYNNHHKHTSLHNTSVEKQNKTNEQWKNWTNNFVVIQHVSFVKILLLALLTLYHIVCMRVFIENGRKKHVLFRINHVC